jgi:hypothetical protein
MQSTPKKLQKLRTFQSDLTAAQGPVPAVAPLQIETPAPSIPTLKSQLPPVLNAKKPEPKLPPVAAVPSPVATENVTVVKQTTPPTIPSTLQNQVDTVLHIKDRPLDSSIPKVEGSLIQPPRTPVIANKEPVQVMDTFGNEDSRGTVITNQKRGRFKLLPSIWEALQEWFTDAGRKLEKRAENKRLAIPTVRTIEDRKDTIKKAASIGALAPKDDYAKLAAKVPPRQITEVSPAAPAVMIAEKEAVPEASWSHFEGDRKVSTAPQQPVAQPQVLPAEPAKPVIPPLPATDVQPPEAVSTEQVVAPPTPVEPVRLEIGQVPRQKSARPVPRSSGRNFRWLFYLGLGTTAIIAAIGGASLVTWLMGESPTTVVPVAVTDLPATFVTPVPQSSVAKVALPRTRAEWYDSLLQIDSDEMATVIPIINIGGAERPATTEETMTMLALKSEPALNRSVKEITFMLIDNQPAIVLKVSAYDSTFGGLLLSEAVLSSELAPLFGETVSATYKVGVGTVPPEFVDELADNHDVRVLKDEMENEGLVYGFTDQNTVIITTNKETFTSLSSRLR